MDFMTSTPTSSSKSRIVNAGKVAAVIAAAGATIAACGDDGGGSSDATTTTAAAVESTATVESGAVQNDSASSPYQDGEYTATGHYTSPGGHQQLGVTVTLSNSVITALTLDTSQTTGTAAEFQGKFKSGIDPLVVGKNIDELDVSKVSGSSLTSGGFNDAIDQIKSEAQA